MSSIWTSKIILTFLTFALFLSSTSASALPKLAHDIEIGAPGSDVSMPHLVVPMQFIGSVDGVAVNLTGDIQEAIAQWNSMHPSQQNPVVTPTIPTVPGTLSPQPQIPNPLSKEPGHFCCNQIGQGWAYTSDSDTGGDVDYLNGHGGNCQVGAVSCARVACQWGAAIYLCNDNTFPIAPPCTWVASYATDIRAECWQGSGHYPGGEVCGQKFDTDLYNIVVRKDSC